MIIKTNKTLTYKKKLSKLFTFTFVSIIFLLSILNLYSNIKTSALVVTNDQNNTVRRHGGGSGEVGGSGEIDFLPFEVDPELLVPLRNDLPADKTKDRLNLVFVYSSEIAPADLLEYKNFIKSSVDLEQQSGSAIRGFLQTEPIKSNRNKINLWSYEKAMDDFQYLDFQRELATVNNSLGVKYATPILIKPDPTNTKRSYGSLPIIDYTTNKNIEKYWPGNNTVMYLPKFSYSNSFIDNIPNILTHEFGHTLFNLADEYFESGNQTPLTRYPNCAPDLDTAKTWWESLIGQEDSVAVENLKLQYPQSQYELINANYPDAPSYINFINIYAKDYKVGYYPGGCFTDYGIDTGQIRPTETSVMRNESAASFGAVNSREINKVFALFSGENQAIFKLLPSDLTITNFQRDYSKYFENPDCKNIIKPNNKKYLKCSFLTKQGKTLSNSPLFKLELTDSNFEGSVYNPNPTTLANSNCALSNNQIVCDEIEVTTLDFNKNVNLWFNFNSIFKTFVSTKEENTNGNLKLNYFDTIDLNTSVPNSTGGVITITNNNTVNSSSIQKFNTNESFTPQSLVQPSSVVVFNQALGKDKDGLDITDPYNCKAQTVTGNVKYTGDKNNLNSVVLKINNLDKNSNSYTFNPTINEAGDYEVNVKDIKAGNYQVEFSISDKSGNTASGSYTFEKKDICAETINSNIKESKLAKPKEQKILSLVRSGSAENKSVFTPIATVVILFVYLISFVRGIKSK